MSQPQPFDVIIIGSGQAGNPLASAFSNAGKRTAMIEREHIGGTCVNVGCTPTKTMVASARVAYLARRSTDYGVHFTGPVTVDLERVRERKRAIVKDWHDGSVHGLQSAKLVTVFDGEGSMVDSHTVQVKGEDGIVQQLSAPLIILNVGERPLIPDFPGLAGVSYLDSTSIQELATVPEHLVILGAGYIALEFGQMFRRFGSRVTIIQRSKQVLGREDDDVAEGVAAILREDGIDLRLETTVQQVRQSDQGGITVTVNGAGGIDEITGSHLLVATGRRPNTDSLHASAAGIELDERGYVKVNDRFQTSVEHIYAVGDCKGGPAFTHISYDDYRILADNLLKGQHRTFAGRVVPYTVFIDPQLGRVGLSERQAMEQGRPFRVAKLPMSHVARAVETDETRGFMKAIIDTETHQILGAAVLGIEGGEIATALQIAMMGKLPYTALRDAAFSHPTLSESLNNLFMTLND